MGLVELFVFLSIFCLVVEMVVLPTTNEPVNKFVAQSMRTAMNGSNGAAPITDQP